VVRFVPAEQPAPVEGPWVYTAVERAEATPEADGLLTPEDWSAQWTDAGEEREAVIAPDAEVLCAQFCVPGPGHIDGERGTYEVRGQDFIDYLDWGNVVIAEVEFAEADGGMGPREIVRITELFPAPPE
jgi:hypothetical protein